MNTGIAYVYGTREVRVLRSDVDGADVRSVDDGSTAWFPWDALAPVPMPSGNHPWSAYSP